MQWGHLLPLNYVASLVHSSRSGVNRLWLLIDLRSKNGDVGPFGDFAGFVLCHAIRLAAKRDIDPPPSPQSSNLNNIKSRPIISVHRSFRGRIESSDYYQSRQMTESSTPTT